MEIEKHFVVNMLFGNLVLPDRNKWGCNWKGGLMHVPLIDCFFANLFECGYNDIYLLSSLKLYLIDRNIFLCLYYEYLNN